MWARLGEQEGVCTRQSVVALKEGIKVVPHEGNRSEFTTLHLILQPLQTQLQVLERSEAVLVQQEPRRVKILSQKITTACGGQMHEGA